MRTFALDRMTGLGVTGESFKVPANFSVEEYLTDSLAIERDEPRKVVIEFDHSEAPRTSGDASGITARRWKNQLPDGRLRMTLTVGDLGEVMRWVMSLGSHAWVVEPEDLRKRIAAEVEAVRRY